MAEVANREAFQRFQPICVQLTREHTLDNVATLMNMLQTPTDPVTMQQLQEYLLFPIRIILKQSKNKSENLYTEVIKCQTIVLGQTEVGRFEMFQDIFTSLCVMISSHDPQQRAAAASEELKLAVVQCLAVLVNSSTLSVLEHVYTPVFLPPLGHAVSLLLHLVNTEGMRELRLSSINCLQDLALLNRKAGKRLRSSAADMFASFLPGITMAMMSVATGDSKQGHLITKASIGTWCKLVCLVMGDNNLPGETSTLKEIDADKPYQKLIVARSTEWVTMTTQKLSILVTKMAPLSSDSNWRVRLAMVEWADLLLQKCTKSLQVCVPQLLEVLVGRVNDDYKKVSTTSRQALRMFQQTSITDSKPLVEILENSLHELATSLPRRMRTTDDDAKYADICLFNGYLQLLGPYVCNLVQSYSHMKHISSALLQVLQLDCTGLSIIQERTPALPLSELQENHTEFRLRKCFKHFTDNKIHHGLVSLCRLIGYHGDLDLVVDHFLEKFMQSSFHRKQSAFILNEILLGCIGEDVTDVLPGAGDRDKQSLTSIVRTIIDEYIQSENWDLITCNQSEDLLQSTKNGPDWQIVPANHHHRHTSGLTVEQINSNILQICLQLEGIANGAKVLGEDFQPLLIEVLYSVLEKIGDENHSVSQSAHTTLTTIASVCLYRNIQELLHANADYLVNSISLRLRHLVSHPKAPLVLMVTVAHSNQDILPLVDDTVLEVLQSLDNHYGERAVIFLRVLHSLITSIGKWFPSSNKTDTNTTESDPVRQVDDKRKKHVPGEKNSVPEIQEFFKDYLRQKHLAETLDDNIPSDCAAENAGIRDDTDYMDTDQKKESPKHVVMVTQVLERCVHLLASSDPRLRLLVLDTITQCVLALQNHQDQLLPLIHKVWPPFVLRLTDAVPLVIIKTFEVLKVLGDTSGDFIRQRVVKDVIPKVTALLQRLAPHSERAGAAYRFTVSCRLQLCVLHNLGPLCLRVGLAEHQLGPILHATRPYLSSRQHEVLQQEAVDMWLCFAAQDPDCVWLFLREVYSPQELTAPHPCFKPLQMAVFTRRNEFADNIQKILETVIN